MPLHFQSDFYTDQPYLCTINKKTSFINIKILTAQKYNIIKIDILEHNKPSINNNIYDGFITTIHKLL